MPAGEPIGQGSAIRQYVDYSAVSSFYRTAALRRRQFGQHLHNDASFVSMLMTGGGLNLRYAVCTARLP
jgi:hypothetical protein